MSSNAEIERRMGGEYKAGFISDIQSETLAAGLSEDTVRFISTKKGEPEWLLEWRLKAYHQWLEMKEPEWAHVHFPKIDYQEVSYYSAPKSMEDRPKSLDEIDPELLAVYDKLGIPLQEQMALAGIAVDAVFDSVSLGTTFKAKLEEAGVIFMPISEAVHKHPELIKKYMGQCSATTRQLFCSVK